MGTNTVPPELLIGEAADIIGRERIQLLVARCAMGLLARRRVADF